MAGEPLGDPLGDPFPWAPLLSPLNMVVEQCWRVSSWRRAGRLAGSARWGAGRGEGRQFLGGPSGEPGCACTHPRPHSRPLLHNQFGRKGQSRGRGAGPAREGSAWSHPQPEAASRSRPMWGETSGCRGGQDFTDRQTSAWVTTPSPGWAEGPGSPLTTQASRARSVVSSDMMGSQGPSPQTDSWHRRIVKLAPPSSPPPLAVCDSRGRCRRTRLAGTRRGSQSSSRGTRTPLDPPPSTPCQPPGAAE